MMHLTVMRRILPILAASGHDQMSYRGAMGYPMSGYGRHELLETVYASNTVSNILSGKGVRGHVVVGAALHMLLISNIFGTELPKTSQDVCALNDDSFTAADELDTVQLKMIKLFQTPLRMPR